MNRARVRRADETGVATLGFALTFGLSLCSLIVLVDIAGYLVAAARAQQLADAAALAAVSTRVDGAIGDAIQAASEVVVTGNGQLERCDCGGEDTSVEVSVTVPGLLIPTLGAQRVTAAAQATLTEQAPLVRFDDAGPRPDGPPAKPSWP